MHSNTNFSIVEMTEHIWDVQQLKTNIPLTIGIIDCGNKHAKEHSITFCFWCLWQKPPVHYITVSGGTIKTTNIGLHEHIADDKEYQRIEGYHAIGPFPQWLQGNDHFTHWGQSDI